MLKVFFTVVYFRFFCLLVDRNANTFFSVSPRTDWFAIACWFVSFIISIVLAHLTVKEIDEKYSK